MDTSSDAQYEYNMKHKKRGLFVLINNREFHKKTGMGTRNGTDVDASNLYQRFKALGFEVHVFHNQTTMEMRKIMAEGKGEKNCTQKKCINSFTIYTER